MDNWLKPLKENINVFNGCRCSIRIPIMVPRWRCVGCFSSFILCRNKHANVLIDEPHYLHSCCVLVSHSCPALTVCCTSGTSSRLDTAPDLCGCHGWRAVTPEQSNKIFISVQDTSQPSTFSLLFTENTGLLHFFKVNIYIWYNIFHSVVGSHHSLRVWGQNIIICVNGTLWKAGNNVCLIGCD